MTAPLTDSRLSQEEDEDPRLFWQKRDQQRQAQLQERRQRDTIAPIADVISVDTYKNRLQPIKSASRAISAGQIMSSEMQRQRQMQLEAQKLERQRQAAYQAALGAGQTWGQNNLGQLGFSSVGNTAGGWGAGGAEGVANMMRAVGFPESAIAEGIAITRAESGWRPDAINTSNRNGSVDQGLWQINTVHRGQPWYPQNLNDPLQSTRAAFELWKRRGGSWGDWSVYNSGAYRQFLQPVPPRRAVSNPVVLNNSTVTTGNGQLRMLAVSRASAVIGLPYVWGGNSLTSGVDCSGLVQQVYRSLGISLPRTAQQQAEYGRSVTGSWRPVNQLRPGDLVAWYGGQNRGRYIGHIAVYAGNGQIIEAPSAGMTVRRRALSAREISGNGGAFGVSLRFPGE